MGFEVRSPLIEAFTGSAVVSASNFHWRGLHDSLTHKSNIQFCVSSRAMCGRWCRWVSFEPLSFLFSATGRRSSISFRPYRRTPTGVVSQSLQRSRPHVCWLRDDSGEGAMAAEWRYRRVHPHKNVRRAGLAATLKARGLCASDDPCTTQ
jgi:hypothetical protein